MKVLGYIMIGLVVLALGAWVVIKLNAPGAIAVRKAFNMITANQFVDARLLDEAKSEVKQLQIQQKRWQLERDSLIDNEQQLHKQIEKVTQDYQSLSSQLDNTQQQLTEAQKVIDQMNVTEQLTLFDQQTTGTKASYITDHQGHEVAIVEPVRIADANWKIHEGVVAKQQNKIMEQMLAEANKKMGLLEAVNLNQELIIQTCYQELALEIQKREALEKAMDDTVKKGKKIATTGIGAAAATVGLVLLILL